MPTWEMQALEAGKETFVHAIVDPDVQLAMITKDSDMLDGCATSATFAEAHFSHQTNQRMDSAQIALPVLKQ